uniref:Ipa protein n=1 Tax=Leptosphaeria maculans TaxID=5022 RepID=B0LLU1_LEPMC|nr:ipa protein [Plenodomus lingam]
MIATLKDLHADLARKFQRQGPLIEQTWRSLQQRQRETIVRDGSLDGVVLKHPDDTSMGAVYKILPEWNMRDLTAPSSDFLLNLLRHRATTSLQDQYASGVNGSAGDYEHIVDMMCRKNLQLRNASDHNDQFTTFHSKEKYGQTFATTPGNKREVVASLRSAFQAGLIVPQSTGELIMMRQLYILQALNITFEDILDVGSTTRTAKGPTPRPAENATTALAKLSVHSPPTKTELPGLAESAIDQQVSLEDYIDLVSTEPTILAYEVNLWYYTRPELVADDRGRILPAILDKFISGAFFDAVRTVVRNACVWKYMACLLRMLGISHDRQFRAIILQELSKVCAMEYTRARDTFKRYVSTGTGGGRWFRRATNAKNYDKVRVGLKCSPESLTVENPQLHYMLRLCQEETTWTKSADWLQKLTDLHRVHPLEQGKMLKQEFDSLGDLAIIVTFIQCLSGVVNLPTISKKGQSSFVSRVESLDSRLESIKAGLRLDAFVIPIDNLLEPGMASGALEVLHTYVEEKLGGKLTVLYQNLVDSALCEMHERYQDQKAKLAHFRAAYVSPTIPQAPVTATHVRKAKEKTRPVHSLGVESKDQFDMSTSCKDQPTVANDMFRVKKSTLDVFCSLLSRSSEARSFVAWDGFVAAMADIGFSIMPKMGSIYAFRPPERMGVQRGLTLHRPHQSNIEGTQPVGVFSSANEGLWME